MGEIQFKKNTPEKFQKENGTKIRYFLQMQKHLLTALRPRRHMPSSSSSFKLELEAIVNVPCG